MKMDVWNLSSVPNNLLHHLYACSWFVKNSVLYNFFVVSYPDSSANENNNAWKFHLWKLTQWLAQMACRWMMDSMFRYTFPCRNRADIHLSILACPVTKLINIDRWYFTTIISYIMYTMKLQMLCNNKRYLVLGTITTTQNNIEIRVHILS